MGIDFGTGLTKVCYRLTGADATVRLAKFNGAWFLPSVVAVDNGTLVYGEAAHEVTGGGEGFKQLKMVLAGSVAPHFRREDFHHAADTYANQKLGVVNAPMLGLCSAFLAHVMKRTSDQIRLSHPEVNLANNEVCFMVGMPIQHERDRLVRSAFERVLALAQNFFDNHPDDLAPQMVCDPRDIDYDPTLEDTRVFFRPETSAQITSYLRSGRATRGVRTLIDVGAGTTDVAILWVDQSGAFDAWGTYVLATENIVGGMADCHAKARGILAAGGPPPSTAAIDQLIRRAQNYPDDNQGHYELNELMQCFAARIRAAAIPLWHTAYGTLHSPHNRGQGYWDPNLNEDDPPLVLLLGCTFDSPRVREALAQHWMGGWGPFPTKELPTPTQGFKVPPGHEFNLHGHENPSLARLAVAYGLTLADPCRDFPDLPGGGVFPRHPDPDEDPPPPPPWIP